MSKLRKSYVLCGHHKCATRWLTTILKSSNEINLIARHGIDAYIRENRDWIRETIKTSPKPVVIDYIYSICDEDALKLLKEIDPDMGAIVIYREPVDIILSMHNYQRTRYDSGSLVGYARDVMVDKPVADKDFVESVKSGVLCQQFERLFRFDRNAANLREYFDSFLELKYEDMAKDETAYVSQVCDFIGVSRDFQLPPFRINPSMAVRSSFLNKLISKSFLMLTGLDSASLYRVFRHGYLKPSPFYYLLKFNYKHPHFLPETDRAELMDHFREMVQDFSEISDLDIASWGYELTASKGKSRLSA